VHSVVFEFLTCTGGAAAVRCPLLVDLSFSARGGSGKIKTPPGGGGV